MYALQLMCRALFPQCEPINWPLKWSSTKFKSNSTFRSAYLLSLSLSCCFFCFVSFSWMGEQLVQNETDMRYIIIQIGFDEREREPRSIIPNYYIEHINWIEICIVFDVQLVHFINHKLENHSKWFSDNFWTVHQKKKCFVQKELMILMRWLRKEKCGHICRCCCLFV